MLCCLQFQILTRVFSKLELADGDYVSADDVSVYRVADSGAASARARAPEARASVLQAGAVALSVSRTDALWRHLCSRGAELGLQSILCAAVLRPRAVAGMHLHAAHALEHSTQSRAASLRTRQEACPRGSDHAVHRSTCYHNLYRKSRGLSRACSQQVTTDPCSKKNANAGSFNQVRIHASS